MYYVVFIARSSGLYRDFILAHLSGWILVDKVFFPTLWMNFLQSEIVTELASILRGFALEIRWTVEEYCGLKRATKEALVVVMSGKKD